MLDTLKPVARGCSLTLLIEKTDWLKRIATARIFSLAVKGLRNPKTYLPAIDFNSTYFRQMLEDEAVTFVHK